MKTILRTIISHFFPSPVKRTERKMLKKGDKLCKRIVTRLKPCEAFTYPPYSRKNLLQKRLKQYQQVRGRGSSHVKVAALMKLDKAWKKFQTDFGRKLRMKIKNK